ncbi:MAG: hypothetical protein M3R15_13915 [Acidobacteriota bacterium]|nr:hypothetical protein [Acidobacteriota bacterium]
MSKALKRQESPKSSGGFGFENVEVSGQVVKKLYAVGSKSEHQATFLETPTGTYILRRRDGNPFYDPELEKLVEKAIRCTGVLTNNTLIMSNWTVL